MLKVFVKQPASRLGARLRLAILGQVFGAYSRVWRGKGADVSRSEWRWFRHLVHNAPDIVVVTAPNCSIRYANRSAEAVLGCREDGLLGTEFCRYVHHGDLKRVLGVSKSDSLGGESESERMTFRLRHADGSWRQVEAVVMELADGAFSEKGCKIYYARDVSKNNAERESLVRRTLEDPLTGLANRACFMERLEHVLVSNSRRQDPVAVLFLDLDNFKAVNDGLGHEAGDRLLAAVGQRLRSCVRPGDTAARLGGDEFVVLLEEPAGAANPARLAERILSVLSEPMAFDGHTLFVTASIGVAISDPGASGTDLLRVADAAMYRAKKNGRGRYIIHDGSKSSEAIEQFKLENDLWRALEHDELRVHYQPIVSLEGGGVVGMEALLRWEHPRLGLLFPEAFVPLAERSGLITPIGFWLLEEACRQAKEWSAMFTGDYIPLNVNLSARQLLQPDLVESVVSTLDKTGYEAGRLNLEITESVLVDGWRVAETHKRLDRLGVRLVIDDFGTGYASLANLARFPVRGLKIDRSFAGMLEYEPDKARLVVSAAVSIAKALELGVVAEGVESAQQAAELRMLGCEAGQGFYFSEPLPAKPALQFLGRLRDRAVGSDIENEVDG